MNVKDLATLPRDDARSAIRNALKADLVKWLKELGLPAEPTNDKRKAALLAWLASLDADPSEPAPEPAPQPRAPPEPEAESDPEPEPAPEPAPVDVTEYRFRVRKNHTVGFWRDGIRRYSGGDIIVLPLDEPTNEHGRYLWDTFWTHVEVLDGARPPRGA